MIEKRLVKKPLLFRLSADQSPTFRPNALAARLEQFRAVHVQTCLPVGRCSDPAVAEDKLGKEAEAGDALASSMQADAAQRHRRQAGCYR